MSLDYFCSESLEEDLKGKTVRGGIVVGALQLLKFFLNLLTVSILAKLLRPSDFGFVAKAAFFSGFASLFVDAGFSMAIVQRESINHRQVTNLFWMAVCLGSWMAVTLQLISPIIAAFYDEQEMVLILMILSLVFILSSLAIQHQALLRRRLEFTRIAIADFTSLVAGQITAITWATIYQDSNKAYWAMVLLPVVSSFTRILMLWHACPWRPGLPKPHSNTKQLVYFGTNVTGFSIINFLARNISIMLIGYWWGDTRLGYYERANRLLMSPAGQIIAPISSLVIPGLSRLKESPAEYRRFYRRAVQLLGMVTIPLTGLLSVTTEPTILIMLGKEFHQAIPIYQALIPAAFITSIGAITGWCFSSWGHVNTQFKVAVVNGLITILTIFCCVPFGIVSVAIGISTVLCLLRIPITLICYRDTPLSWRDSIEPLLLPITLTGAAIFATLLANNHIYQIVEFARASNTWLVTDELRENILLMVLLTTTFVSVYSVTVIILPSGRKEIASIVNLIRNKS